MPPRLALVSTGIRRDLLAPLSNFARLDLLHFYRTAAYGDLTAGDLSADLVRYTSPLDLYDRLVQSHPDIIQGVEPFSIALQPYLWACYLAARRIGARLVSVTLENRPLEIKFGLLPSLLFRRALSPYFQRACLIVALNAGAQRNLHRCGVAPSRVNRALWGTWGVDLAEFSPSPNRPPHPPVILFAGRLVPEKGILLLLDAFAVVRAALPGARLLIAGDGLSKADVERRAAGLKGVDLLGAVKNRAMPALFRRADILAMPSLTTRKWEEQVGMVALQAMACGVPVVATQSGAIPEYVPEGRAGLLVPENDRAALASALLKLLRDSALREQLGRAGRTYACEHYDAAHNVRFAEQLLEEHCLAGRL